MDFEAAIAPEANLQESPPEEQFLQVTVNGDLPLLLPGVNLVEITKLGLGQVVPMFAMAPWVVGLYNWRGDMLWVADLGHFLGFAPWYSQAEAANRHTVVIIQPPYSATQTNREQSPTLGLVVSDVDAMVAYPETALQPLTEDILGQIALPIEPGLLPFLRGCCFDDAGQLRLIVDGTKVLEAMAQT